MLACRRKPEHIEGHDVVTLEGVPGLAKTLTVRTLAGGAVARLPAAYGAFDFDGRRLAYLKAPKVIAVARLR